VKNTFLAVLTVLFAFPAFAQDVKHAPTVAQCQADQRLWNSKLEDKPHQQGLADISYGTLMEWIIEMGDCEEVDPENRDKYLNTGQEAITANAIRLRDFIRRRKLFEEFLKEDAAGER